MPATFTRCRLARFAPRYCIAGRAPFLGGSLASHVRSAGGKLGASLGTAQELTLSADVARTLSLPRPDSSGRALVCVRQASR